jgi:hypothetical protein
MTKNYYMICAMALAAIVPGSADAIDFAVGAHGGSMGTGVEATFGLNSHLNVRAGINSGEYEYEVDIESEAEGLKYQNPTFDFDNQYLMLDFYPFSDGSLHLTAGYFTNKNTITTSARVDEIGQEFGGQTVDLDTEVSALISFADGGYAGIGFGNAARDGLIHFGLDIGVVMQGSPQVDIDVTDDPPAGFEISEDDITAEEEQFEEENKDFDMWPVINLSLSIQLF